MKILWHSNAPWTPSGYGQQTALFTPRIKALGHEVAISAFYGLEGSMLDWEGMRVYPTDNTRFGKAMLPYYVGHFANGEVDPRDVLVLTLMDVWVLNEAVAKLSPLRMASWVPVDHDPVPPGVSQFFTHSGARPIAMSRFGEAKLQEAGLDPLYVPHGVDTTLFRPQPDRDAIREGMGVPDGAFVIGMVANNQGNSPPRKAFPQVFQAFSIFQKKHPDAFLYLHADMHGMNSGIKLRYLAETCGIPERAYGCSDQMLLQLGLPAAAMSYVYSTFDVLASPSYGEGFGIPIVEAQACGVPVIVTDWTAMPELCGAGWLVEGDPWFDTHHGSFFMCPSVQKIVEAFEHAYEARDDQGLRDRAVEFAAGYDVDTVMRDYWVPALDELEKPREVAPLTSTNGSRAQRRAGARAKAKVTA
ncbi:MAG: glycosyltransferase family 4 protein [Gemmatimonadaceae bacterium]|nr:glycosyltransferase family 4 protein [Gemmatimonadaceae bacterium]